MFIAFLIIVYQCIVIVSPKQPQVNYLALDKSVLSVHPLASSSGVPPVTIEVSQSNDTLINVYFTSTPQHLAILIHLNSPSFNTAYSSVLISTDPPTTSSSAAYSGTITFISTAENSTVGFHIPPSPNGAVITIDVPKGTTDSGGTGKTKIRLIHLSSTTLPSHTPTSITHHDDAPHTTTTTTRVTTPQVTSKDQWIDDSSPTTEVYFTPENPITTESSSTLTSPTEMSSEQADWSLTTASPSQFQITTISPERADDFPTTEVPPLEETTTEYDFTSEQDLPSTPTTKNWLTTNPTTDNYFSITNSISNASTTAAEFLTTSTPFNYENQSIPVSEPTTKNQFHTTELISETNVTPKSITNLSSNGPTTTTPFSAITTPSTISNTNKTTLESTTRTENPFWNFITTSNPQFSTTTPNTTTKTSITTTKTPFFTISNKPKTTSESTTRTESPFWNFITTSVPQSSSTTPLSSPKTSSTTTERPFFTISNMPKTTLQSTTRTESPFWNFITTSVPQTSTTTPHTTTKLSTTITERPFSTIITTSTLQYTTTNQKETTEEVTNNSSLWNFLTTNANATPSSPPTISTNVNKTTETVKINSTCPTLYNIYVNVNFTASINKTHVKTEPPVNPLNWTDPTFNQSQHDVSINEISSPRKFPQLSNTTTTTIITSTTTHLPQNGNQTTTSTTTTVSTTSSPTTSSVKPTQFSTTVVSVLTTTSGPPPPNSYWIVTVIVAKTTDIDEKFINEVKENLGKIYQEAYKRQQQQLLGFYKGATSTVKRSNNDRFVDVQLVNATRINSDEIQLIYYLVHNKTFIPVNVSLSAMETINEQEAALLFGHVVVVKARPYLQVPTSAPYKVEQGSSTLSIVFGCLTGILLLIIIVIIVIKLKCKQQQRKEQMLDENCSVTSYGQKNRLRVLDDEASSVVVIEEGQSSEMGPKLSDANTMPPPVPLKRKHRPLPPVPNGEYTNVASLAAESKLSEKLLPPPPKPRHRPTLGRESPDVVRPYGVQEYLQAPISQIPTTLLLQNDQAHAIPTFDLKSAATQTDFLQQSSNNAKRLETNSEVEVLSSDIQWHTIRQRMQEMIDNAVTSLKNTSPSPKFRRSHEPNSVAPIDVQMKPKEDLAEHMNPSPSPRRSWQEKEGSSRPNEAITLKPKLSRINENSSREEAVKELPPGTKSKKAPKDLETEFLLRAIKEELQKFKQNFNTNPVL